MSSSIFIRPHVPFLTRTQQRNLVSIMRRCPICDNDKDLAYWQGTLNVFCPNCKFVYADKIPDVQALEQTYSETYFRGNVAYRDYESDKQSLQGNFKKRIRTLRQFKPEGSLFEVGCAFGFFLECARQYWLVSGSDISPAAIQYARDQLGLDVRQSDFEHLDLAAGSCD